MKTANPKISKTATTSGTVEIVGSIDDLLTQILVHLPLKPLVRLKLVSKHWNSIISDPKLQFIRNNNNRERSLIFQNLSYGQPIKTRVLVSFEYNKSSSSSNPPQILHHIPDTLRISHSCNGLLILTNTSHSCNGLLPLTNTEKAKNDYYVYNPTTNQCTTILDRDNIHARPRFHRVVGMNLAFDPTKSPHYKVVCVWDLNDRNNLSHDEEETYELEVYSSETRSWEKRGGGHMLAGYPDFDKGVYWKGAIHWLNTFGGESIYFNPDDHDEMPRKMPSPPICGFGPHFFGESCGHLHFVDVGFEEGDLGYDDDDDDDLPGIGVIYVYEMRRDYSEWFVKYRVNDYSQHLGNYGYEMQENIIHSVVCCTRDDEDSFLVLGTRGEVWRYSFVHNTFVKAFDFDNDRVFGTRSFQYIESTCSV